MNFWSNPQNNPLKVLIVVVIIAIAGYFVYHHLNSGNAGSVINRATVGTTANPTTPQVVVHDGTSCATTTNHVVSYGDWDGAHNCCSTFPGQPFQGCAVASATTTITFPTSGSGMGSSTGATQ